MREAPRRLLRSLLASSRAAAGRTQPLARCALLKEALGHRTGVTIARQVSFPSLEGSTEGTLPLTERSVAGEGLGVGDTTKRPGGDPSLPATPSIASAHTGQGGRVMAETSSATIEAPELDPADVPSAPPPRVQLYPPSTGCVSDFMKGPDN